MADAVTPCLDYDEFILREISPETLLAASTSTRR
jgi:hypothetical protein